MYLSETITIYNGRHVFVNPPPCFFDPPPCFFNPFLGFLTPLLGFLTPRLVFLTPRPAPASFFDPSSNPLHQLPMACPFFFWQHRNGQEGPCLSSKDKSTAPLSTHVPFCFALVTNNGRGGPRFRIHCTSCHWRALFFGTCYQHKLVKAQAAASNSHEPRLTRVLQLASKSVLACPSFLHLLPTLGKFSAHARKGGEGLGFKSTAPVATGVPLLLLHLLPSTSKKQSWTKAQLASKNALTVGTQAPQDTISSGQQQCTNTYKDFPCRCNFLCFRLTNRCTWIYQVLPGPRSRLNLGQRLIHWLEHLGGYFWLPMIL